MITYKESGVDVDAGNELVNKIKPLSSSIGGFSGLCAVPIEYTQPVLVSSTDGVGTKLLIALKTKRYDTIGTDLVAMCINDILCSGAKPLFFLDYMACGKLSVDTATKMIEGIHKACKEADCILLGGETAEMPGMYDVGKYDLAGFAVGVVEKEKIIGGYTVQDGDVIMGLRSSGLHSNGFSLVRAILTKVYGDNYFEKTPESLLDMIMEPTKIYVDSIKKILHLSGIRGISHITGGGLLGNVHRSIPKMKKAVIQSSKLPKLPIMDWIKLNGDLSDAEMYKTFNCGVGMTLVVNRNITPEICEILGDEVVNIGHIESRDFEDVHVEILT